MRIGWAVTCQNFFGQWASRGEFKAEGGLSHRNIGGEPPTECCLSVEDVTIISKARELTTAEYHMVGFHMRPTIYKLHHLGLWLFISVLCLGPIQFNCRIQTAVQLGLA